MMVTLIDILQKSTDFLQRKGVDQPRLNAEHLLAHGLGLKRMDLYLQFERPLTEGELAPLRELIRRRATREPLQYIIGSVDFAGLDLKVDSRCLIPRPETEELVDYLATSLSPSPDRILDLGCGSGAICLGLAAHFPRAEVFGVEADPATLALALENSKQLKGRSHPVRLRRSNWFSEVDGPFDLIVSNPPYLSQAEWEVAAAEVREFEPLGALVAEEDGYACLREIIRVAPAYLVPSGLLALETGPDQHETLTEEASALGWGEVESRTDLSGRDRFLFLRQPPAR
jgi:release factor glutamine methyltransferase